MTGIATNSLQLARAYARRIERLDAAAKAGIRKWAIAVNREQVKNLSGGKGAAAGSYPVPVRTGNLRRDAFWQVESPRQAIVGNTADYAQAIHEGQFAGRSGAHINPRPFLDDAAREVDGLSIMSGEVERGLFAI